MTDLGTELHCIVDLDEMFTLVTQRTSLIQALARRFITRRGTLVEDETYGFDLREWLGESVGNLELFRLQSGCEEECFKDERVKAATARLTFTEAASRVELELRVTDDAGPFTLVITIDAVTVEVLEAA